MACCSFSIAPAVSLDIIRPLCFDLCTPLHHVYVFRSKRDGKVYVGQTYKAVMGRWIGHCEDAKAGSRKSFATAIRQEGPETFELVAVYHASSLGHADMLEEYWISFYHSNDPNFGYNMTSGGGSNSKMSDEVKVKISTANTGMKKSPECVRKVAKALTGRKQSLEHVAKRAASNRGQKRSLAIRRKMSRILKRHVTKETHPEWYANVCKSKRTPEARASAAKIQTGKKYSKASREKMRRSRLGKHNSKESNEKNRQSQLKRFRNPAERQKLSLAQKKRYANARQNGVLHWSTQRYLDRISQ